MAAKVGTVLIDLKADTTKLVSGMERAERTVSRAVSKMRRNIRALIGVFAADKIIGFGADIARGLIDTAAKFEQFESVLGSIQGSSEAARRSMDWIGEFAATTPYSIEQVTDSFVRLKAYGLDPTGGTLRTLGDTAAAMGKPLIQAVEAIADAVTGENERLKEFGIKAQMNGDKVAYAWTDASGKTRRVVVDNNREIIQSTLEAIFNSKYAGAMSAMSHTWDGILSNIADSWTNFQRSIMSQGLFDYIKALALTIGERLSGAFASASAGAAGFTSASISAIEAIIIGIGNLIDFWHGIDAAWQASKIAFFSLVLAIGKGAEGIANIFNSLGRGIVEIFVGAFNVVIEKYNEFLSSLDANGRLSDWFRVLGITSFSPADLYAQPISLGKFEPIKIDMSFSEGMLAESKANLDSLMDSIINEDGRRAAVEFLEDVKSNVAEITAQEQEGNEAKKQAEEYLSAISNQYDQIDKGAKKAGSGAKKHTKALKDQAKEMEKSAHRFTDDFANLFEGMLKGDLSSAFKQFFEGLSSKLVKPWIDSLSQQLSSWLDSAVGSLGSWGSGLLGIGLGLLGSLSFGSEVSQEEIDAAAGRTEFDDESLQRLGELYEEAMYPQLKATRTMSRYLRDMRDNFGALARAFTTIRTGSGIDLTGELYQPTYKYGFLGFSSKSVELIGSGIELGGTLGNMDISGYLSELVKKSSFFGLFKSSYTTEKKIDLPQETIEAFGEIVNDGVSSIITSAVTLGFDADSIRRRLEQYQIDIGKVNLKDLSDDEVQTRLSNVFSEIFSGAVESLTGEMSIYGDTVTDLVDRYARSGEDALETLSRIAVEYEQVGYSLSMISSRFGDVAAVLDVADQFENLGDFGDAYASYVENFLTDAEKVNLQADYLARAFENLGVEMPRTNEEFKRLIESFDWTQDGAAETYAELLKLSDAFAEFTKSQKDLWDEITELNQEKDDILAQSAEDLLGVFQSLRQKAQDLAGTLVAETDDELSFKFYAERYNQLKADLEGFFDGGVIRPDADMDKLRETYDSLASVTTKLSGVSDAIEDKDRVTLSLLADTRRYLGIFATHEEVMKVIITGDETNIAEMTELVYDALAGYNVGLTEILREFSDGLSDSNDALLDSIGSISDTNLHVAEIVGDTYESLRVAIVTGNEELSDVLSRLDVAISAMTEADEAAIVAENQRREEEYRKQLAAYQEQLAAYRSSQKYNSMAEGLEDALSMISGEVDYTTRAGYIRIYEDSKHDSAWFDRLNASLSSAGLGKFSDKGDYRQLSYSSRLDGGVGTLKYLEQKLAEYKAKMWVGDAPTPPEEPTLIETESLRISQEQRDLIEKLGQEIVELKKELREMKEDGLDVYIAGESA